MGRAGLVWVGLAGRQGQGRGRMAPAQMKSSTAKHWADSRTKAS